LKPLGNIYFDTSAVCESGTFDILFSEIPIKRILYGSDNIPVGIDRGKYISFAHGWAFLRGNDRCLDLSHCHAESTFVLYEQLRAMKAAARRCHLKQEDIEDMFWNNAMQLVSNSGVKYRK
jgi:hypothetical protein